MSQGALGRRLTLVMLGVAIGAVIVSGAIMNYAIGREFAGYVRGSHSARKAEIASTVGSLYAEHGSWAGVGERLAASTGPQFGLRFRVTDARGLIVYDSGGALHAEGQGQGQGVGVGRGMGVGFAHELGSADSVPLTLGSTRIGTLTVSGQGPGMANWTAQDVAFRRAVNRSAAIAGLLATLGVLIASWHLSTRLVRPLKVMTQAASAFGEGRLSVRVPVTTNDEVGTLGRTLNSMAEQLERLDFLRRKLTADVSHELRTPLAILQGHMEAIQDGVMPCSPEAIESMHEEILRLTTLVDGLRELSLLEHGRVELHPQRLDLSEAVRSGVEALRPLMQSRGLEVSLVLPTEPVMANADSSAVDKVLRNLLMNAAKYTNAGGYVRISLELGESEAKVAVHDTGIGISPTDLSYVFERFYRTDASRARDTGGTGIGLAIAKELVEAHGGRMWAESEAGEGSSFAFTMPLS